MKIRQQKRHIIRCLAHSLIQHGAVMTTTVRAKLAQRTVERMITKAKNMNLENYRTLYTFLANDRTMVQKLQDYAKTYENRQGGYTSIKKVSLRKGDGAVKVLLKLV